MYSELFLKLVSFIYFRNIPVHYSFIKILVHCFLLKNIINVTTSLFNIALLIVSISDIF